MTERENLPAILAEQGLAATTDKSGSLVSRGLSAIRDRESQSHLMAIESDPEKLFRLGMRYLCFDSEKPGDDEKAREYLLAAAKLNHAEAQFELAYLLRYLGEDAEWLQWLKCSAHLGFGPAQYYYAKDFELPEVEHDELMEKAFAWFEERAQSGDAQRQCDLALMDFEGETEIANSKKEMYWLKAAAAQEHPEACYRLGLKYLPSKKVSEEDVNQGIYWLTHAADLGVARACESLGKLYLHGHMGSISNIKQGLIPHQIIAPNRKLAVFWYERGIELGWRAMAYDLGRLYLMGEFLDQDLVLAEKWLLHAATAGLSWAQNLLGSEYASGKRLKLDANAAIHWLKLASPDMSTAQLLLAEIYRKGEIVPKDIALSVEWLTKAIDGGTRADIAMKTLGLMYANGEIGEPDQSTAQEWFGRLVAYYIKKRSDNPKNTSLYAFELAGLYETGEGVEKDLNKAIELYKQAARHSPEAVERLHELGYTV